MKHPLPPPYLAQLTVPLPSGAVLAAELSAHSCCCSQLQVTIILSAGAYSRVRAVSQDECTCACIAQLLAHTTLLRKSGSHSSTRCTERCQARLRYFRLPFFGQPASYCGRLGSDVVLFRMKFDAVSETKDYVSQML